MSCKEAFPLDGSVAFEHHIHLISSREDGMRFFSATEFAKDMAVRGIAVVNGNMIVSAFLMGFHLEDFEHLGNAQVIYDSKFIRVCTILIAKLLSRYVTLKLATEKVEYCVQRYSNNLL